MSPNPLPEPILPASAQLAGALQRLRIRRGWNMDAVATRAGISRTTLFHLERGVIRRPRASTLHKLAQALEVSMERLLAGESAPPPGDSPVTSIGDLEIRLSGAIPRDDPSLLPSESSERSADSHRREFDRTTNPIVSEVAAADPDLFAGWTDEDWDELYSQFATGGALREEGVRITAARINHDRETLYRLRVLLQTHLADVASGMVDTLYKLVSVQPVEERSEPCGESGESLAEC